MGLHFIYIYICIYIFIYKGGQYSAVGRAMRFRLDDLEIKCQWGGETGSKANPESCTTGTWSFVGVKWLVRGADHPLLSSAALRMCWNYKSVLLDLEV